MKSCLSSSSCLLSRIFIALALEEKEGEAQEKLKVKSTRERKDSLLLASILCLLGAFLNPIFMVWQFNIYLEDSGALFTVILHVFRCLTTMFSLIVQSFIFFLVYNRIITPTRVWRRDDDWNPFWHFWQSYFVNFDVQVHWMVRRDPKSKRLQSLSSKGREKKWRVRVGERGVDEWGPVEIDWCDTIR